MDCLRLDCLGLPRIDCLGLPWSAFFLSSFCSCSFFAVPSQRLANDGPRCFPLLSFPFLSLPFLCFLLRRFLGSALFYCTTIGIIQCAGHACALARPTNRRVPPFFQGNSQAPRTVLAVPTGKKATRWSRPLTTAVLWRRTHLVVYSGCANHFPASVRSDVRLFVSSRLVSFGALPNLKAGLAGGALVRQSMDFPLARPTWMCRLGQRR